MTASTATALIIAGALVALLLLVAVGWWYGREVEDMVDRSGEHL